MVNPMRGEVEITLDGVPHAARLTLGALAELETQLATGSLVEMAGRFETGRFSAADVIHVIVAGLRGGGWSGTRDDLLCTDVAGGAVAAAQAAAQLLAAAFVVPQ
ncbi:gene transfer agent family protein [Paracoccus aerodenitrificans]|uniref:gene transfer agent family protein n=1 Tax=Paracoccus aerodenitrificans TaxID=3017781 RepID=UPI0022F129D1|nr:gene transfer agent family protein [Paracoccus aerodenitrificans]WBU65342.1 gene transfer agent family protein [Paracoccus aerodenitrificans]